MGVTKFILYVVFAVSLLSYGDLGFAQHSRNTVDFKGLQRSDECAQTVKQNMLRKLKSPPKFDDLKSAVRWTRLHLSKDVQGALGNAAQDTLLISGFELEHLAKSPKLLYRVLEATTSTNLWALGPLKPTICSGLPLNGGLPLLLKNSIWSFLTSNKENIVISQLYKMAGDNMDFESRIFLLMLTLDATGQEWSPSWLDKAKEAQAELSQKLNERTNRKQQGTDMKR